MDSTAAVLASGHFSIADALGVLGLAIALGSAVVAIAAFMVSRRQAWVSTLFQILDRLERPELRDIRHNVVYQYPRQSDGVWAAGTRTPEETSAALDRWGAELDALSILFFSGQVNRSRFFDFYGDVIIRSVYRLSPYAQQQRAIRGDQFWLPFQELSIAILKLWAAKAGEGTYPKEIGMRGSHERFTPELLWSDKATYEFLRANGR